MKTVRADLSCGLMSAVMLLGVAGCAAPTSDPSLTPAENQLHQRAAQYDNTLIEGTAAGAVVGAIAGALLAHNRAQGAAIGAAAGAALGGGIGYMVANSNQAQAQTEDQYHAAIKQANDTAQQSAADAGAAEQEAADLRQKIDQLGAQYTAKQVSAEDYQSQIGTLRQRDHELATIATHYQAQAKAMMIYASGRQDAAPMQTAAAATQQSLSRIQASEVAVSNALGAAPKVPVAPGGAA